MFLVLVPFVAGILIAENYALPLMMVAVLFVLMIAVAAWTLPRKMAWGYMAMAIMLTGTPSLVVYLPIMIVCSIITGIFTGLCAQLLVKRGKKIWKTISN